jgi:hypothetical protein
VLQCQMTQSEDRFSETLATAVTNPSSFFSGDWVS